MLASLIFPPILTKLQANPITPYGKKGVCVYLGILRYKKSGENKLATVSIRIFQRDELVLIRDLIKNQNSRRQKKVISKP